MEWFEKWFETYQIPGRWDKKGKQALADAYNLEFRTNLSPIKIFVKALTFKKGPKGSIVVGE